MTRTNPRQVTERDVPHLRDEHVPPARAVLVQREHRRHVVHLHLRPEAVVVGVAAAEQLAVHHGAPVGRLPREGAVQQPETSRVSFWDENGPVRGVYRSITSEALVTGLRLEKKSGQCALTV